mmetsp:Transcript_11288/g.32009  ORF Transcript_11288/g.32009 Transcript_11288/m.32009 type:complete len:593 (+) Transcript_11288:1550-3328(+)
MSFASLSLFRLSPLPFSAHFPFLLLFPFSVPSHTLSHHPFTSFASSSPPPPTLRLPLPSHHQPGPLPLATGRYRDDSLLEAVAKALLQQDLNDYEPQNFANIVWGFGKLGYDPGSAIDYLAREIGFRLPAFSSQELFNTVWGLAKLRRQPEGDLLELLGTEAARRVNEFTTQELGNTAWAYARLERPHPALFRALTAAAAPRLPSFQLQHLVNLLWALSQLQHEAPELLPKLVDELRSRVGDMRGQHLAMCLRSMVLLRVHPGDDFLEAVQRQGLACAPRFRRFEICGLMWSYAMLATCPQRLVDLLRPGQAWNKVLRQRDTVNNAEMVRGLWGLAVLGLHNLSAMRWLSNRVGSQDFHLRITDDVRLLRFEAVWLLAMEAPELSWPGQILEHECEQALRHCEPGTGNDEVEARAARAAAWAKGSRRCQAVDDAAQAVGVGRCERVQASGAAVGWLIEPPSASRGGRLALLHLVARRDMLRLCPGPTTGGGPAADGGPLQISGTVVAHVRLLLGRCSPRAVSVALLLEDEWEAACKAGQQESCLAEVLARAQPVGGDGLLAGARGEGSRQHPREAGGASRGLRWLINGIKHI